MCVLRAYRNRFERHPTMSLQTSKDNKNEPTKNKKERKKKSKKIEKGKVMARVLLLFLHCVRPVQHRNKSAKYSQMAGNRSLCQQMNTNAKPYTAIYHY